MMTDLPKNLREFLKENFEIRDIKILTFQKSSDGTRKYIFRLHDKLQIEGVLIPGKDRVTACISTQVGCPLRCKFCATGTMGLKRNLTAAEIYEQAYLLNKEAEKYHGRKLTNIVIMGMGEPLLNLDNTLAAIDMITSNAGLAMSPQRITLSTV
jgi:23S rRNA (adenine2503-C2)-methyltransferase